ncbi:MAG: amidohydrolase family protein [Hyphomicrobiaceae bacterium]
MIIDSHAHLAPKSLIEATRAQRSAFPSVQVTETGDSIAFSFCGGKQTRPISPGLHDIPARLTWMDEQGIDRQVVGGWLDMFGNELPVDEGTEWSRLINTALWQASVDEPRLIPLAALPMQDGAKAAEVLREAHGIGFKGAMIGTQPKGVGGVLDDPALEPFWQAADELGTILFIHPVFESGDARNVDYGMPNAVGRVTDTLIAISRMIYSGHVLRYANVKIVIGIGGAALPFIAGRLRRNFSLHRDTLADPDASLAQLYYDTLVHDPRILRFVADMVGTERIMMGSDKPFPIGDPSPMQVVAEAGFSSAEQQSINAGLAQRLLGL